ncbi:hypothetical protein EI77_03965 [Prosthecobacter fusiformis]|uniref:Uncharacterized protein n=1 Tax=Prosthecobacter fusiformis TaxID=48464 RepID=A0A4R7RLI1_9BACT|nr:hypothetical protein [Prosthecobacter fusiformis]TDU64515.1 hypothetical protein EI77_03965 [Prosthecobacter fusiformis]
MKRSIIFATLSILALFSLTQASEFSSVPATVNELKDVIDLDVKKYKIDFDHTGEISLEVKGLGVSETYKLKAPSKSATLTLYYERGPKSAGSTIPGHGTLHFWIGNDQGSTSSYLPFEVAKARVTTTGFQNDIFQVLATSAKDRPDDSGYSLRVINKP